MFRYVGKKIVCFFSPIRELYNEIQVCRNILSSGLGVDKGMKLSDMCNQAIDRLLASENILNGVKLASNAGSLQKTPIKSPDLLGRISTPLFEEEIKRLRNSFIFSRNRDLPISAFVITYNEHPVLELSLLSLFSCSELIVVDKGTTDESKSYIPLYATRIIESIWTPIVEDTRAEADSICSLEWRIFLDADEFLTKSAINFLRDVMELDKAGKFPYDAIAFPRINFIFGEKAEHNIYAPSSLIRCYRKGFYQHNRATHIVSSQENIRVLKVNESSDALIIHLNQDNLYEYFEKMNRYTETYITQYPSPSSADDIYDFIFQKISAARNSTMEKKGNIFDAVCESITSLYFTTEFLKQWEQNRKVSIDESYANIVKKYFSDPCNNPKK